MKPPTCGYLLGNPPNLTRCGWPVSYQMSRDEDGNLYRDYHPFCDKHALQIRERAKKICPDCGETFAVCDEKETCVRHFDA